jgi:hypothetical protein
MNAEAGHQGVGFGPPCAISARSSINPFRGPCSAGAQKIPWDIELREVYAPPAPVLNLRET